MFFHKSHQNARVLANTQTPKWGTLMANLNIILVGLSVEDAEDVNSTKHILTGIGAKIAQTADAQEMTIHALSNEG